MLRIPPLFRMVPKCEFCDQPAVWQLAWSENSPHYEGGAGDVVLCCNNHMRNARDKHKGEKYMEAYCMERL